jgi:DNA (cytosine-5)-methyltransferase 1
MIADDLFAGAGGWDIAAAALGIRARGVENMPAARATRDAAGLCTIHDDVWTYRPDGTAQGLIASPPCQTFSMAGKGSGRKALDAVMTLLPKVQHATLPDLRIVGTHLTGDERTALVLTPLWFALHGDYEWLAWEQVGSVLPVWEACADELRQRGWSVWTGRLHAEQYGVPQTRTRAFLLARRDGDVKPPAPTHSRYYSRSPERLDEGVPRWVSMAEALGWPDDVEVVSNYGTGGDPAARGIRTGNQPAATVTEKVGRNKVLRMTKQANSAVRSVDQPAPTIAFGHDHNSARWFTGDEWMFHRPATTIVESFRPDVVAAPGWRTAGVRCQDEPGAGGITVEEAATLQSFPPLPWQGAKGKRFLQVGNAIPPLLALHALKAAAL